MGHITNASLHRLSVKLKWLSSWVALGNESIRNFRRHLILARLVANIKWMSSWMAHGNAYIRNFMRNLILAEFRKLKWLSSWVALGDEYIRNFIRDLTILRLVSNFFNNYGNPDFSREHQRNNKNKEVNKKSGNNTTNKNQKDHPLVVLMMFVLLSVSARAFNKIYTKDSKTISNLIAQVKIVFKKRFPPNITLSLLLLFRKLFQRFCYPVLGQKSLKSVKGFFISGRAVMKIYKRGLVTRSKKSANIRYATQGINLRFGYVGVKCSMMLSKELRKPMYYKFGFAIVLLKNNSFLTPVRRKTPVKLFNFGMKTKRFLKNQR